MNNRPVLDAFGKPKTTPTGVTVITCEACGRKHPETRTHCPTCGQAHLFHCNRKETR